MKKKESPKEAPEPESKFISGFPGFSRRIFAIAKFILGLCLLPFVYGTSVAFLNALVALEKEPRDYFWGGVITTLIVYLFVWEPAIVYERGQKLVEVSFGFLKPLVKVAPYLLPIYTIVTFIIFLVVSNFFKGLANYVLYFFGLTMAFHLISSAKTIRSKKENYLKANYIFGFSFIYVINLTLLVFFLSIIFEKLSFVNFCNYSFQAAQGVFSGVYKQFFL